ncbi:MAG: glucose-6-phosphate isomerase family protein [bacterium]|nr:glucose-6-phosphate isomerase family protein [bacterium]
MSLGKARTLDELRPVLLDPLADGPEEAYFMIRGKPNISVWPAAMYGKEYNKSVGHYHKNLQPETYWVLHGEAVFVLQKRSVILGFNHERQNDKIEAVRLVRLKAGDSIHIEGVWGHAMVNVGEEALVTSDDAPSDASHSQNDYETIRTKHGMAYYIVKGEDDKPRAVPNPHYTNLPKPTWEESPIGMIDNDS